MAYGGDRSGNGGLDNGDVSNPSLLQRSISLNGHIALKMTVLQEERQSSGGPRVGVCVRAGEHVRACVRARANKED